MHLFETMNFLPQASVYLLQAHEGPEQLTLWHRILESNVINVVIVALILGFLIKKFNLLNGIDAKREQIATEIQAFEARKKEAQAQLEATQRLTANLKNEVEDILNTARESAEVLSAQILNDAKLESVKIIDNTKRRVELEQRSAIKELERRLLNEALQDARAELAQSLSAEQQKRSVESFLDELVEVKGGNRS